VTLVTLLWATCTTLWAIFTPPHRTFAARITIFQPLWLLRAWIGDGNVVEDLRLFLVLHGVYGYLAGLWRPPISSDFAWIDFHDDAFLIYLGIFGLLAACGALAGGIVHRGAQLKPGDRNAHLFEERIDERLLPPLLIPSRTSHSRMFPQRHSFMYSYLFVGIPVGASGKISNMLSVDGSNRGWFHINSDDYLARGSSRQGLGGKLKEYLHTQGVTDRDYAFAYLITAPKFLGYSFNPASFWYVYDSETVLRFIVVEVNNTFGERRMYLLRGHGGTHKDGLLEKADGDKAQSADTFTDTWRKDFHVSPFNSTKGSYSIKAVDPLIAYQHDGQVKIDNTIVLRSSKDSAKLVARVWSDGTPRDATTVTWVQQIRFIAAWWWVGFATFPRIVAEAGKLFFRKKLHVWYRPEVVETSLGRSSTKDEEELESHFRAFLQDAVGHAEKPLCLHYVPADSGGKEVAMYSPGFTYEEAHERTLSIKVLSPAFYSRLVHYAHIKEAFDRECLATEEKNRTISIDSPHLLSALLEAISKSQTHWTGSSQDPRKSIRWSWMRRLRCPAPAQSYVDDKKSNNAGYDISDIRSFRDAELDRFVRHQGEDVAAYQRIVLKLFLAERFAGGIPALVSLFDWVLRATFIFGAMYFSQYCTAIDVLRPKSMDREDVLSSLGVLLLANSVHIWSVLKS